MMVTEPQQNRPEKATQRDPWSGTAYVREAIIDGSHGWAVFNSDGDIIFADEMRCKAWFFVTSNDLRAAMRH